MSTRSSASASTSRRERVKLEARYTEEADLARGQKRAGVAELVVRALSSDRLKRERVRDRRPPRVPRGGEAPARDGLHHARAHLVGRRRPPTVVPAIAVEVTRPSADSPIRNHDLALEIAIVHPCALDAGLGSRRRGSGPPARTLVASTVARSRPGGVAEPVAGGRRGTGSGVGGMGSSSGGFRVGRHGLVRHTIGRVAVGVAPHAGWLSSPRNSGVGRGHRVRGCGIRIRTDARWWVPVVDPPSWRRGRPRSRPPPHREWSPWPRGVVRRLTRAIFHHPRTWAIALPGERTSKSATLTTAAHAWWAASRVGRGQPLGVRRVASAPESRRAERLDHGGYHGAEVGEVASHRVQLQRALRRLRDAVVIRPPGSCTRSASERPSVIACFQALTRTGKIRSISRLIAIDDHRPALVERDFSRSSCILLRRLVAAVERIDQRPHHDRFERRRITARKPARRRRVDIRRSAAA